METTNGPVRGVAAPGSWAFLGIPYAAPPIAEGRFLPPRPASPWQDVLVADRFGPACPQVDHEGSFVGDEDCLSLNVWTPREAAEPLAVMVWVHGGKNKEGSSSDFSDGAYIYDGAYLAEHGPAVVVTLNYRLGSLGFLAHPALAAESERDASGNYALLDQIAALRWVKDNARAFGADPERILAFGHSAGANDVCALVASPEARDLFTRAMLLSGSGNCFASTRAQAEAAGAGVAGSVGCAGSTDVPACLREASAEAIIRAAVAFDGGTEDADFNAANVDGHVLLDHPLAVFSDGAHEGMPILISSTSDEYTTLEAPTVDGDAALRRAVAAAYGDAAVEDILALYPSSEFASANDAWFALQTDDWFICPARTDARALARNQAPAVWRALFGYTFEQGGAYRAFGAGHGMDLFFGFHNFGSVPASPRDLAFADLMVGFWTRFAQTGDPNGEGAPGWPLYDADQDDTMRLDEAPNVMEGVRPRRCDYWDGYWGREP